jgi:hypothetical protein
LAIQLPGQHFAMGAGQEPPTQPQTLPPEGPNPAVVGGLAAGGMVAILVGMLLLMHHRAKSYDFAAFDVGWQFQMVLDSPVTLDLTRVAAAAAAPSGN